MLRRSSKVARSVAAIFMIAYFVGSVLFLPISFSAQAALRFNRVISCTQNSSSNTLVLKTLLPDPIAAPVLQYLPNSDGKMTLIADFPGLIWTLPTRLIRPSSAKAQVKMGIQEVHVGQFQDVPPTLRIAISSWDRLLLQKVDFSTSASSLIVKLPAGAPISEGLTDGDTRMIKPIKASASEEIYVSKPMPPVAPAIKQSGAHWERAADERHSGDAGVSPVPRHARSLRLQDVVTKEPHPVKSEPKHDEPTARDTYQEDTSVVNAPTISLVKTGTPLNPVLNVSLVAEHKLAFKTFRLHNPERYVVDFENLPELAQVQLPATEDSSLLSSLRIGNPEEGCARLVLDLPSTAVFVEENLQRLTVLSLTLKKNDTKTEYAPKNLYIPKGTLIVLDAGHGGSDPGAQRGDVQEKEITLQIVQKLKRLLDTTGARVIMTRHDDTFVSLEDRVTITNNALPKVFLSVHINALESSSEIHGIETYYQTEHSKALAEGIHQTLVSLLKAPDRAVRKARFYVINHTASPAILAEVGYISNKAERDKLISSDYQTKIAEALAYGVMLYLNKSPERERDVAHSGFSNRKSGIPIIMPKTNTQKQNMDGIQLRHSLPKVLPYPFLHGGKACF